MQLCHLRSTTSWKFDALSPLFGWAPGTYNDKAMTRRENDDPIVGDELVEVSLRPHNLYFIFVKSELQIGAPFTVSLADGTSAKFLPKEGIGSLSILWALVGKTVEAVIWNDAITVRFADGEEIFIEPSEGRPRGLIRGRGDMTVEDF